MVCPTCRDQQLVMSERQGVEIDYCPKCRGVWLDRGEIDKIIERSVSERGIGTPSPRAQTNPPSHYTTQRSNYGHSDSYQKDYKKQYKKKSIWNELQDFFD